MKHVPFVIGLTDHLEGPHDQPSAAIFDEVADLVRLADQLGVQYAWFSRAPCSCPLRAHAHALAVCVAPGRPNPEHSAGHGDHLSEPAPPARHRRAGCRRRYIDKGPDGNRIGSGSTPEFSLFGLAETNDHERHAHFEHLGLIRSAWSNENRCETRKRRVPAILHRPRAVDSLPAPPGV